MIGTSQALFGCRMRERAKTTNAALGQRAALSFSGGGRGELAAGQLAEKADVRASLAGAQIERLDRRLITPGAIGNTGDKRANLERDGGAVRQTLEALQDRNFFLGQKAHCMAPCLDCHELPCSPLIRLGVVGRS